MGERWFFVKARGFDEPHRLMANSASQAKYRSGKAYVEAGMGRSAMSFAWYQVEWVRRDLADQS